MIGKVFLFLEIAFWIFMGLALIYLIVKRYRNRDRETFEKRDN
jgi:positive regulator of sigma E activity